MHQNEEPQAYSQSISPDSPPELMHQIALFRMDIMLALLTSLLVLHPLVEARFDEIQSRA